MYRRNGATALTAAALLTGLAACGAGSTVVQAADAPPPGAHAGPTAEPAPATEPDADQRPAPRQASDAVYGTDDPSLNQGPAVIPARTIVAAGIAFHPKRISASPGSRWTFDNQDIVIHRIQASTKHSALVTADAAPGTNVTFRMPAEKGTYRAECVYHGNMAFTIVVE